MLFIFSALNGQSFNHCYYFPLRCVLCDIGLNLI